MMKRASTRVAVVLFSLLTGSQRSNAQVNFPIGDNPPDIVRSFRLIPSKSTLEQTGGFAGFDFDYRLFGKFDIRTGYEGGVTCAAIGCPPPAWYPVAKFENVHVSALLNHPAAFAAPAQLSNFVDLEKLRGTFRPDEPRRLNFKGKDAQGFPFEMLAVQRGPLLHLLGQNRAECCDFYNYKIDALAHIAPYADFNFDGTVDRLDFDRLLGNIGKRTDASLEDGDADADGDVDGSDFLIWQRQLGASVDLNEFAEDSLSSLALGTATVPEPASLALWISCVLLLALFRRRGPRE